MTDRLALALAELVAAIQEDALTRADPNAADRLLSIGAAADALGLGRSLLYGEIGAGRIRSVTVGRRRLIPSSAIPEYIASRPR